MARKKQAKKKKVTKKKKAVKKVGKKKTAKKTAKRKTVKRKTVKRKAAKKPKKAKKKKVVKKVKKVVKPVKLVTTPVKKSMTKSEVLSAIAEGTGLTRKEVGKVVEALGVVIKRHVSRGGAGQFVLPGLAKFKVVRKPATKARKGINPFTGEPTIFKAKPARNVVKVRPLKALKEMAK